MAEQSPAPPTGTVTFLFTDVEGSTQLWEDAADEMSRALERHDEILRSNIEGNDGYVFSTGGDAFCAAFTRAGDALTTAVEAQRLLEAAEWPEAARLRVRMGVHTGEAHERNGDYFGSTLNRTARIMSAGHGGQILVSEATASLLTATEVDLREAGTLQLRGLSRPEIVSQVLADGLSVDFRPLRSQLSVGNLPPDRDLFVGREREIVDLAELIRAHRLVTLTGAGGVGKTRLATTCGWRWSDEYPDGVWLVSLAEVGDDDEVVVAVASTLGVRPQPGLSIVDSVAEVLSHQRVLLILDNCEHVLDGAAELVQEILGRPGRERILATSREGLSIRGERLVAVRSLATDADGAEAVELFYDRAIAAGWTPAGDDGEDIRKLCRRLDGIPLAIELAAARARSLGVPEMLVRLDDRFRLLAGRRRRIERHQTLRATVGWSYDMLSDGERRLFDRLSVFAGPFTLPDAEAICADDALDRIEIDDHLLALVDKSMVNADAGWYRLLETLNQFGAEQLAANDEPERFQDAHLRHFTEFAIEADRGVWGSDEAAWIRRLDTTWGNCRVAVERALDKHDPEATTSTLAHLSTYMSNSGKTEVGPWMEAALAVPGIESCHLFPTLLAAAAWARHLHNDLPGAISLSRRADDALAAGGEDLHHGVLAVRAYLLGFQGDWEGSMAAHHANVNAAREGLQRGEEATALGNVAFALTMQGRFTEGAETARSAIDIADRSGHPSSRGYCRFVLGQALLDDDPDQAEAALCAALEFRHGPLAFYVPSSQARLARLYALNGDAASALEMALDSVKAVRRTGSWALLWNLLLYTSMALEAVGEHEVVAQLLGGLSESWSWFGVVPRIQPWLRQLESEARSALGERRFNQLADQGTRLTASDAAELAERAAARHLTLD